MRLKKIIEKEHFQSLSEETKKATILLINLDTNNFFETIKLLEKMQHAYFSVVNNLKKNEQQK